MTDHAVPYGSGHLSFALADKHLLGTLRIAEVDTVEGTSRLVQNAVGHPFDRPALRDWAEEYGRITIIVPDKTRRAGVHHFLSDLIEQLGGAELRLLFANGTHGPQDETEQRAIVTDTVFDRIPCRDHNSRERAGLVFKGTTCAGTPVHVNRWVEEADAVLAVGAVNYHYFAGFGGGVKLLVPGVAGYETAMRNHSLSIDSRTGGLHAGCRNGNLDGNPVYEDLVEAARLIAKPAFLLATVLDAGHRVVGAFAGDLIKAHRAAAEMVDSLYRVPIAERADLVIASAGGYPKDVDIVQTHKALQRAFEAVRAGGVIVLAAECRDGIGSDKLTEWMRMDADAFRERTVTHYARHAQTAASIRERVEAARVYLVSSLDPGLVRTFGMQPAGSLEAALADAHRHLCAEFKTFLIPDASLALPTLR